MKQIKTNAYKKIMMLCIAFAAASAYAHDFEVDLIYLTNLSPD